MPWTFAHPAAVLPLMRWCPQWLSMPALVLGSLTPDLGYYLAQRQLAAFAHTPAGLLALCIPLGLLLLWLLVRLSGPATALLPAAHRQLIRQALQNARLGGWPAWARAALSVFIGACSHVLWDSFTHANAWAVGQLPPLQTLLFVAGDREIRVFNLLQHLSTLVGILALALVYRAVLAPIRAETSEDAKTQDAKRLGLLCAGTAVALLLGSLGAILVTPPTQTAYVSVLVVRGVVASTSCWLLTITALSAYAWRRWERP